MLRLRTGKNGRNRKKRKENKGKEKERKNINTEKGEGEGKKKIYKGKKRKNIANKHLRIQKDKIICEESKREKG